MSSQTPLSNQDDQSLSNSSSSLPTTNQDWRDTRRAAREERRARRGSADTAWVGGVVLILLGVIFLLQEFTRFQLDDWWALFFLLPAFGSFATAWNIYRQTGRLNKPVRGALISGFVFLLITATFLFNWDWGLVLPVLLIIWGVTLLLNSLLPE